MKNQGAYVPNLPNTKQQRSIHQCKRLQEKNSKGFRRRDTLILELIRMVGVQTLEYHVSCYEIFRMPIYEINGRILLSRTIFKFQKSCVKCTFSTLYGLDNNGDRAVLNLQQFHF